MGKLTKEAYVRMCDENMEWLKNQPDCLEKQHIETIVADSPERYYDDKRLIASLEAGNGELKKAIIDMTALLLNQEAQLKERVWIYDEYPTTDGFYIIDMVDFGPTYCEVADGDIKDYPHEVVIAYLPITPPITEKES